ncbi:hypothetical protein RHMOL_Rhmol11G0132400 [Rhododendron molle]|uniref:Uncharacterized protein n=1 Tax=Rhododendron molle TaxID=49168 RepID=A0ACC0LST9_RHOML|nr:hypothetical protein RHMOL_Rhmol11G0132400 [Rhododendron molle]
MNIWKPLVNGSSYSTVLRYSLSIDGHFSDQLGEEVTKPGGYYSQLQEYDAVIRSSTLLRENFSLPVSKEPGANQPLQIILARNPSSPIQVPVMTTEVSSKVVIFTNKETSVEPEMAQKGIETVVLDGMNLMTILEYCKRRGLCSVLLDIRGNIGDFEEMLREGFEGKLLQKVVVEMLPIWKGSKEESATRNPVTHNVEEKDHGSKIYKKAPLRTKILQPYCCVSITQVSHSCVRGHKNIDLPFSE